MAKAKAGTKKVALGVGLGLAAAAAGAGYYFFGTPSGKKAAKKAAKWTEDFKGDVIKKAKKLQKFDEQTYRTIVDESVKAYERVKSIDKNDLAGAAHELKQNWKHIEAEINRTSKKETKAVKKAVKKVANTAAKKVVKAVVKPAKKVLAKPRAKKAIKKKA